MFLALINECAMNKKSNKYQNILLIEDNLLSAKAAMSIMSAFNCYVDHAPDGQTALQMLKAKSYDLALVDVDLPDTTGIKLVAKIKTSVSAEITKMDCIALTGNTSKKIGEACKNSGMIKVLVKPLSSQVIIDALELAC
jgi:CheY-like chemotaxis protein